MCAQECGHWADALKEVRKEGFCRERQTEEVEVEIENSSRFQTGLQRLDAKVVLTEKKKKTCLKLVSPPQRLDVKVEMSFVVKLF